MGWVLEPACWQILRRPIHLIPQTRQVLTTCFFRCQKWEVPPGLPLKRPENLMRICKISSNIQQRMEIPHFHPISSHFPPKKKRDFPFLRPAQENMGSRCLASSNSCHICPTSPWGQAPARNWGPAWWTLKTTGIDVNNPYWITHSYGIIYYYMKPIWYHRF